MAMKGVESGPARYLIASRTVALIILGLLTASLMGFAGPKVYANDHCVDGALTGLIADLDVLMTSNSGTYLEDKLEDAAAYARTALYESEKMPPDYLAASGNIEGAVGVVAAAVKDGLLDSEQGDDLMDRFAAVVRLLAEEAINQSVAQGADPTVMYQAEEALSVGDGLRGEGAFKDAVNKYRDALAKASSYLADGLQVKCSLNDEGSGAEIGGDSGSSQGSGSSDIFEMVYDSTSREMAGYTVVAEIYLTETLGSEFDGEMVVWFQNGGSAGETYILPVHGKYSISGDEVKVYVEGDNGLLKVYSEIVGVACSGDSNGDNFEVDRDKSVLKIDGSVKGEYRFMDNPGCDAYLNLP